MAGPSQKAGQNLPRVEPASRAAWRAWLAKNHANSGSVWLVLDKAAAGRVRLAMSEAVEDAICFGWIDSLPRKLDDTRTMLLVSPRKRGSSWSAVNKARAEKMIAAGRMAPAGLAAIEAAKADGAWSRLDTVEALAVPDDLATAFARHAGAAAAFASFPRSARRGILEWILTAKTPATREKRVEETARLAARGERANRWPR